MRVLAALSGGVDSAVAAARAQDAGHDVTAVHLAMSRHSAISTDGRSRGCCTASDANDARRVADVLSIPFYVWDVREVFEAKVVQQFRNSYASGLTPNPCVRCNEFVKFDYVLKRAVALGFDALVTGHYAQVRPGVKGAELHRGVDESKDQSYVLAVMHRDDLDRVLFPIGRSLKADVRKDADSRGFAVSTKPDSYDICFIPSGDTKTWLKKELGTNTGSVIDHRTGEPVGTHEGVHTLTVGQRRGLNIDQSKGPFYVTSLDAKSNTATVGLVGDLDSHEFLVERVNWLTPPTSIDFGSGEFCVQIRAHHRPVAGKIEAPNGKEQVRISLREPVRGLAPGQSAVWYSGTRVIGCGTIVKRESTGRGSGRSH